MTIKIPLIEALKNRGVHQGLGQTSNSIKMAALILLPLIGPWFAVQILCTKEQASLYTPIVFGGWIASIVIYFYAKKASAADFSLFPQSGWQFPDGQQIRYDLFIEPNRGEGLNGWEPLTANNKEIIYKDGSRLYKVAFKDKLFYQDPKRDYPDIFDMAIWKLPDSWQKSFTFNGFGEFFYDGLFVTSAHCENIEITVISWDERGASRIPVCVITSCSHYHKQVREQEGKILPKAAMTKIEALEAEKAELKMRNIELVSDNEYLNKEHEQYVNKEPESIQKLTDNRLEAFFKAHNYVTNAGKSPAWKRILLNAKYILYFGIAALIIILISHFILGFP